MIDIISQWFLAMLETHMGIMLFLVLGLGYILGNLRIYNFTFGPVAGVLFVGLLFGNFGFRISSGFQMVGFALFIFSVGYQAGPGFIAVLKKDGLKYFILSLAVAITGFGIALTWALYLELPPGMSAGLLAGGLTSSPTLAAAQDTVMAAKDSYPMGLHPEDVVDNIATGYALTYIFGLVGLIIMIKYLPKIVGINLAKEAEIFENDGKQTALSAEYVTMRTYKITNPELINKSSDELRAEYWDNKSVVRVLRDGNKLSLDNAIPIRLGDLLEVVGSREFFTNVMSKIAREIHPQEDTIVRQDSAQAVVTQKNIIGKSISEINIAKEFGLFLLAIHRGGKEIDFSHALSLQAGDVLSVMGTPNQIESFGLYLGYVERDAIKSDMVALSLGIVIGLIVGTFSVTLGGISIGLGSAGGLLVSGLFIGYRRSIKPTFAQLPEATRWFLMEFGLLLFMAGVGLRAGSGILDALQAQGFMIIIAGISITIIPILVGYFIGGKILKISPALLFGAITGAMTSGAALSVVINEAKSPIPSLGYTGTYAFANVLLVIAGSLIMMF
ncbi:MAG: TrkA C-terminal domain-containing protein [Campylobacterota bacterium]|nr:TrkA C-terminal domain-containing protein [Campylobacterota bacterium]